MAPHTAKRLKEKASNKMRDFVTVAGPLGVTHFMCFSQSEEGRIHLRLMRTPRGPTIWFRVTSYSLQKDLHEVQKHPRAPGTEYLQAPLLVLNGFSDLQGDHVPLVVTSLQSLFKPLNVQSMKLSDCRRVVLFDYDPIREVIDFRHYLITVKAIGATNTVESFLSS